MSTKSGVYHKVKAHNLFKNKGEKEFAEFLMKMGDGQLPVKEGDDLIRLPDECISHGSLVDEIYLNNNIQSEEICILAPKNVDVKSINEEALQKLLPDQIVRKFFSIDTVMSDEETEHLNFTTEYLYSITPSGMPHHELNLKVGCIIMLLRNINSKLGLCNGIK